tara:strand:- start:4737 stop:5822 length:1086 start_codon:yes stop_codon:yes gene_type:complete
MTRHRTFRKATFFLLFLLSACRQSVPENLVYDFRNISEAHATASEQNASITVSGLDNWLFFGPELRHVSVGPFWNEQAALVSRARNLSDADPLPAILDFKRQLDSMGVELLVVPVPPKIVIYPDQLTSSLPVPLPVPRLDVAHQEFYRLLQSNGVSVLDLTDVFIRERFHPEGPIYCRTDTHWSGVGCMIAGQVIASVIREKTWYQGLDTQPFIPRWYTTSIEGDLQTGFDSPASNREELRLRGIVNYGERDTISAISSADSPIVLVGDSHNLIFHVGGDMHASGSGLADQLAFELGIAVDVIGVRGSGATPARVNLLRRAQQNTNYWDKKRLVVWCFSAREFTETDGWSLVPITPEIESN